MRSATYDHWPEADDPVSFKVLDDGTVVMRLGDLPPAGLGFFFDDLAAFDAWLEQVDRARAALHQQTQHITSGVDATVATEPRTGECTLAVDGDEVVHAGPLAGFQARVSRPEMVCDIQVGDVIQRRDGDRTGWRVTAWSNLGPEEPGGLDLFRMWLIDADNDNRSCSLFELADRVLWVRGYRDGGTVVETAAATVGTVL